MVERRALGNTRSGERSGGATERAGGLASKAEARGQTRKMNLRTALHFSTHRALYTEKERTVSDVKAKRVRSSAIEVNNDEAY